MVLVDVGTGVWVVIVGLALVGWLLDQIDSQKARRKADELFEMRIRVNRTPAVELPEVREARHPMDSRHYDITKAIQ